MFLKECMERLSTCNFSIIATVTRKNFIGKFAAKIDFIFTIMADADIGSLKSLGKYLDHMLKTFPQNRTTSAYTKF